jgi:Na+/melibiose symporter-like transporter
MNNPPKSFEPLIKGNIRPRIYEVGTLKYDRKDLLKLFAWLLGGDFVLVFFESIFGSFIPLYSQQFHASNVLIGVMMGSVAGILNLLFGPSISRWSDNLRGPWGRRIPFIAFATPIIMVSIVMMGYAPEVGAVLYRRFVHPFAPAVAFDTVVLTLLTTFVVIFHFANLILINGYTWLQRDVIPQELMARFLSWFRIVSIISGALFSWFVFPHIIDDRKVICLSIGAFYLVVFLLMCRNVKEGEYPPPAEERGNAAQLYFSYFRQCFIVPIYRWSFVVRLIAGMSVCSGTFMIFFQRDTLGVSMNDLGHLQMLTYGASAILLVPMGWICDRFSPFRIQVLCIFAGLIFTVLNFLFNVNEHMLILFTLLSLPITVAGGLAGSAVTMEVYPSEKFGQYFAAGNIMGTGIKILGMYLIGSFLDHCHNNYRMIYIWGFFWDSMGFVFLWLFYREWRRLGGPEHYIPPLPSE